MFSKLRTVQPGVEDLFVAHYDRMLAWALHLTGRRREQAEDLVHDVFIQLALSPPDFEAVENLEGYLFVVLRNLHRYQSGRVRRGPDGPASTVDYDSAEASLKAADPRGQLEAVEELRLVCRYACARKETSKAGGALILRFFHGYYPGEIARLLCTSRPAVKELLRAARAEARLYLDDPERLSFIKDTPPDEVSAASFGDSFADIRGTADEVMSGLRRAVYASCRGRCLDAKRLQNIYDAGRAELMTAPLLAHLVSCPRCLATANRILQLPDLSDRHPPDNLGPDASSRGGVNPPRRSAHAKGSQSAKDALKKYRRRLREVYEHEPRELHVAVNGFVLGAQEVRAEINKQTLGLEGADGLALVEVYSEQGVRLLFLSVVAPPAGEFEQRARAELSGGRTLEVTLSFCGSWPHLEVVYHDPALAAGVEPCPTNSGLSLTPPETKAEATRPTEARPTPGERWGGSWRERWPRLLWPRLWLRPATITLLLTAPLIAAVVGQRLGWFERATTPAHQAAPRRPAVERPPTVAASVAPTPAGGIAEPAPTALTAAPTAAPPAVPVIATAELEVEALRLLGAVQADLGDQLSVRRVAQGPLLIEGVIETPERKAELLAALAPLGNHPAVRIKLQTVAEALKQNSRPSASPSGAPNAAVVEKSEAASNVIAADAELRRYLTARGVPTSQLDDEARRFAARTLGESRRALQLAGAIKNLASRFTAAELQALDPAARGEWRALVRRRAQSLQAHAAELRRMLAPVFAAAPAEADEVTPINSDADLARAAERLFALCTNNDRVVRAAFTISPDAARAAAIKSPPFWQSLRGVETLAARIAATP
jgi:RNA polymerase sigma factor (sigma-70 family)